MKRAPSVSIWYIWCIGLVVLMGAGGGTAWARSGKGRRPTLVRKTMTAPRLPFHKDRICRKDADCVFLPAICHRCHPCTPTWLPVGNRKALRRIRSLQSRIRCRPHKCPYCPGNNWLGKRPVCFRKQCAIAPLRPTPKKIPRSLVCKRHKDCGFYPTSSCTCRPCGLYWRQPANRATIRRVMRMRARMGACRRPRCARCHRRPLGKKVLCVRGRCTVR